MYIPLIPQIQSMKALFFHHSTRSDPGQGYSKPPSPVSGYMLPDLPYEWDRIPTGFPFSKLLLELLDNSGLGVRETWVRPLEIS